MRVYKITIEDLRDSHNVSEFYLANEQSIENLLSHEAFVSEIVDAKTGERFTIKQRVVDDLKINGKSA